MPKAMKHTDLFFRRDCTFAGKKYRALDELPASAYDVIGYDGVERLKAHRSIFAGGHEHLTRLREAKRRK